MQSKNSVSIRKSNTDAMYWFIFARKSVSVRDITEGIDLSLPTVKLHLQQLQAMRLITCNGMMGSTGGRKARAYSVDDKSWITLGLDITRRSVCMVGINLAGEKVFYRRLAIPFENKKGYYKTLGSFIEEGISAANIRMEDILGAGLSLPAILSEDGEYAVNSAPLGEMRIPKKAFADELPFPCTLHNDASAGGYAAFSRLNPLPTHDGDSLVYLSVSDTVGGCIMIDGKMYPGMQQHSAEFGHMTLHPDGSPCYCGQKGCAYVYINTRRLSDLSGGELGSFFDKLSEGNAEYTQLWNSYLDDLTMLIGNIRAALDCNVIIGGYLGRYIGPYMAEVRTRLGQRNMFEKTGSYVRACTDINDITALGAALMHQHEAIRHMIDDTPDAANKNG